MSRGVRDLRDLICVSRLTFHESEEDEVFSDNDRKLQRQVSNLSLASDSNSKPVSPTHASSSSRIISPDSGCVINTSPGTSSSNGNGLTRSADSIGNGDGFFLTGLQEEEAVTTVPAPGTARFKKSRKKNKKRNAASLPLEPTRHYLPRASPLPPVPSIPGTPIVSEQELSESKRSFERIKSAQTSKRQTRVNFDDMMTYMDATIVANWLTRANTAMHEISKYCNKGDNFVRFAHFWLTDFPDLQKRDIFSMEYDILLDEMNLAFAVGRESQKIVRRDLLDMCGAVFKEYPVKLLSAKGSHVFLDYLDILISEKQDQYKKLLSDVRCSTSNRQYAQWLLACRSFALVNIWSSVINFFRNLVGDSALGMPIHDLWSSGETVPHRRMMQAIRLGYIDVIHYLIVNGHVNPTHCDSHRRSLIFNAVMHNQPTVVKYLACRVHPVIEINQSGDTGNTVLHAAANSGNLAIVEILCECPGIDLNCVNPQCEMATPLHLAVMHGHEKIVECLLKHGADPTLKMGTTTARELAADFEHTEILSMLDESESVR